MLWNRQHLPFPNFPKPAQLVEQRWFLASEVAALAQIVGEFEQKLPLRHFEVLPMVAADGPLVAVVDAPVEGPLARGCLSGQDRQAITAVERIDGRRRDAGRGETGRGQIHCDAYLIRRLAGHDATRPPADLRHPDPAFQQIKFAADEWPDLGETLAAIVAGENDERLAPGRVALHRGDNPSDAGIEHLHHLAIDTRRSALDDLVPIDLALARRRFNHSASPWPMRPRLIEAEE